MTDFVLDPILDFIYDAIEWALGLLPDSPIQSIVVSLDTEGFENVMSYINYFVPVGTMLGILTTYLVAVAAWYVIRWALRLAQYI